MTAFLTMEEAAESLRVSRRTLQKLLVSRPFYLAELDFKYNTHQDD